MNKDASLKIFLSITFISFIIYLPAFIVPFSFHNDGAFITGKSGNILNAYNESPMVFVLGRPVLAAYFGIQSWLISNILGLSICRVISFIFLALFNFIFFTYLIKNCRLSTFWAAGIIAIFYFIPPHILSILWCTIQAPGAFNILLSSLAYLVFDRSKSIGGVLAAASLFLIALLCYPASALIFLVFSFAKILFLSPTEEKQVRNLVIRDIIFVVVMMGIFSLLSLKVIVPWGLNYYHIEKSAGLYSMALTNDMASKIGLLGGILSYTFRGIWDFAGHGLGAAIMLFFIATACYLRGFSWLKTKPRAFLIERFCWGVFLFLFANSPVLLARGCRNIEEVGYRVLIPSMVMATLVLFKMFMLAQKKSLSAVKKLTIFFIVSSVLVAFWLEIKAVENHYREYQLAMTQLAKIDFSKPTKLLFVVNERGKTLINQDLPMEFPLLSVEREHVYAYMIEYLHKKFYTMDRPDLITRGGMIFVAQGTHVIDLSSEAINSKNPRDEDIIVRPESSLNEDVFIKTVWSDDSKNVFMNFETISSHRKLPVWFIDKNEKTAALEIISPKPLPVTGYNCFVTTENPGDQGLVKWVLQGSNDGYSWVNLDFEANALTFEKAVLMTYPVENRVFFNRYRFVWNKEQYAQKMGIALIKLKFFN